MGDREKETFTEATPLLQKAAPIVSSQDRQQHAILLRCFSHLKRTVSETKGLFRTEYAHDIENISDPVARQAAAEERRWSIYVSRAVHRFSVWRANLPGTTSGAGGPISNQPSEKSCGQWNWTGDEIPPLDILMVLHALILHTKAFGEDCLRHQRMALWYEGFPLELASQCINPDSLEYSCPESCISQFENMTQLPWDDIDEGDNVPIECFRCQKQTVVPWTTRRNQGLADDGFLQVCHSCKFVLRKDALLAQKLRRDVNLWLGPEIPIPGTCWSADGGLSPNKTTGEFVEQSLGEVLLEETRPTNLFPNMREIVEASVGAAGKQWIPILHDIFKHYQYTGDSSCDLHTAVIRVSRTASALRNADPDILSSHSEVESRYIEFLRQQSKGAAPKTDMMDLDHSLTLFWSTHLLRPRSYSDLCRRLGNSVPVDWELPHDFEACDLCHTLSPPSFARRFLRGLTSLENWKEWLATV